LQPVNNVFDYPAFDTLFEEGTIEEERLFTFASLAFAIFRICAPLVNFGRAVQ
jgi:hypothetical protein